MKTVKRIEMRVTLKIGSGVIVPYGKIFTDEHEPIPDFVYRRLKRGMAVELPNIVIPTPGDKPATVLKEKAQAKEPLKKPEVKEPESTTDPPKEDKTAVEVKKPKKSILRKTA